MINSEYIISVIQDNKVEISAYGISAIGLFGSYARGEQNEESDIDILVDFKPGEENFENYMAVYDIIEKLFEKQKVEVITKNGLSPYIGPKILNEVKYA